MPPCALEEAEGGGDTDKRSELVYVDGWNAKVVVENPSRIGYESTSGSNHDTLYP